MPLRDHFRSPLDDVTSWEGIHGQWPAMIVLDLAAKLPPRYLAAPRVHSGSQVEVDVATFEHDFPLAPAATTDHGNGGLATAVWSPARPTLSVATDLPEMDEYEVCVYDSKRGRRLVAAIELVSPANKDRPEHRHAFVAKCAALLQKLVSVIVVDVVTTRNFNLYTELLELIGQEDASKLASTSLYAVACRGSKNGTSWLLESWEHSLVIGQPLPTLPLWLASDLAVPLDLEASYEATCKVLRIP